VRLFGSGVRNPPPLLGGSFFPHELQQIVDLGLTLKFGSGALQCVNR